MSVGLGPQPPLPPAGRRPPRRSRAVVGALTALLVLVALTYATAWLLTDRSTIARTVAWLESDVEDQDRFPSRAIAAGGAPSPLPHAEEPSILTELRPDGSAPLQEFLAAHGTTAFVVVHQDVIVYERYFNGSSREDLQTSFSVAKSFISTLVGLAVEEGFIGSVEDPVTDYLPELAERDGRFRDVTLRHLLTMSSGLRYREQGLPWSDDAVTYYGVDLRRTALQRTVVEGPPGRRWLYNNYHPLLLGMVLERATGMPLTEYLATRLWQPLGAEADASWSLDSDRSGFEKSESGVNARAVDYARFGLLFLHEGRWGGRQILSPAWVRKATGSDTSADPADFYQYLWWVEPRGDAREPFLARGKYGQLIAVVPEDDVVVVRFGRSESGVDWQRLALQVADAVHRADHPDALPR